MNNRILQGVEAYYSKKISEHGNTFLGVDWNSKNAQYLRFEQLCRIIQPGRSFSLIDFGCGYGELINYIQSLKNESNYTYLGYDISQVMIDAARLLFKDVSSTVFSAQMPQQKADYVVASGIFNVKLDLATDAEWLTYILDTLEVLNELSQRSFAFNALTVYSDSEFMKHTLYYSDPLFLFDYCMKHFSKKVSIVHDYDLYEFTLTVKK